MGQMAPYMEAEFSDQVGLHENLQIYQGLDLSSVHTICYRH